MRPWETHSVFSDPFSWGIAAVIGFGVLAWSLRSWLKSDRELKEIRQAAAQKNVDVGGQGYWFELMVLVIVIGAIAMAMGGN